MGFWSFIKETIAEIKAEEAAKNQPPVEEKREYKEETFYVAGVHYYEKNLKLLRTANPDYRKGGKRLVEEGLAGRKIYQYSYINKPVKLVPEPTNKHDPNAVKVMVAGELVGYISADENVHVLDVINNHDVKFISSFIGGGKWKIASEDG